MAKCTKTKQFLDPFERQTETNPPLLNRTFPIPNLPLYLRVCYSFWNRFRLIRDLEKEEGEEARCLISCALTNGWFIAASRKAWLSVTTRKTTSYPPRTHTRVCGYARGDSRNRQSRNEKRLVVRTPPLIRLTRPIGNLVHSTTTWKCKYEEGSLERVDVKYLRAWTWELPWRLAGMEKLTLSSPPRFYWVTPVLKKLRLTTFRDRGRGLSFERDAMAT